jgi:deoxyribonuclease V
MLLETQTDPARPADEPALIATQQQLADLHPELWRPPGGRLRIGACWVCFPRGITGRGSAQDPAWAAAVVMSDGHLVEHRVMSGRTGWEYVPGLLALRIGPLMERAVRGLASRPTVLLLDATGRDHPRGAGLALQLGEVLGMPTVGVTHRPLVATGEWPDDRRGSTTPLRIGDTTVGCWMRTKPGVRPLAVHPGWQVDLDTAVDVVAGTCGQRRTPEPLRRARQAARRARGVTTAQPRAPQDSGGQIA